MVVGAEVCVELRAKVGHDAPAEQSLLKCVFLSAKVLSRVNCSQIS